MNDGIVFQELMGLILSEAEMLPRNRAPTWPRCKSKVAISVGEPW